MSAGRTNSAAGGSAETIAASISGVSGGAMPTYMDVAWFDGKEAHYERVVTPKTIYIAKGSVFAMYPTAPPESSAPPVGGSLDNVYFANADFSVSR